MTMDNIDLNNKHTNCILKLLSINQNSKSISISNLNTLFELFHDKLAICPTHLTFQYMIIGCCKGNKLNDAIKYFDIAINQFQDIPNVETIHVLIECINKNNALKELEIVLNEMSQIYKTNDILQYNQLMEDSFISYCSMNCYFNNKNYNKCIQIYDTIKNIQPYNINIISKQHRYLYYKSCVKLMETNSFQYILNEKYILDIINMEFDTDDDNNDEMKMWKLRAKSYIFIHKPFDIQVPENDIFTLCEQLFDPNNFVYIDEERNEKTIDLKFLSTNESKNCVMLYLLSNEIDNYCMKTSDIEQIYVAPQLNQKWSIKQENELIVFTPKTT